MRDVDRMVQLAGITEASLPKEAFTASNDRNPQIWIKFDRGSGLGGYYKLETDKWFRSWEGPSKGYGVMFRDFTVTTAKKEFHEFGNTYDKYKITFKYLPSQFDNSDDDVPANYDKSSGWLFIKTELGVGPKEVEAFVKSNMKSYTP